MLRLKPVKPVYVILASYYVETEGDALDLFKRAERHNGELLYFYSEEAAEKYIREEYSGEYYVICIDYTAYACQRVQHVCTRDMDGTCHNCGAEVPE